MSIGRRVEVIFGIILLILLCSFFYANYYLNITVEDVKLFNSADKMVEDILQIRRHEKNFILRGKQEFADFVKSYLSIFLYEIEDYRKVSYRKQDRERIEELLKQVKIFQGEFNGYIEKYKDSEDRPESQVLISSGRIILSLCEILRDESSSAILTYVNNIMNGKIIVLLLFILMGLIALWLTSHRIVEPIKKLQHLCQEVGKESLLNSGQMQLVDSVMRDINSKDEIGELARVYREMLIRYNNSCIGLKEKMKEIEGLYNLKSEFASTVSHELRTPLAPIKEGIDLVLDGSGGPISKEQKEYLEIAKRNVDRLAHLVNDVLDFSKLASKKVWLKTEMFGLNEIIDSVVSIFKLVIEKRGLYIITELGATKGLIMPLDIDRVNQVLTNLIDNAIKFTDEGGITIRTTLEGDIHCVKVCVEDTGIGIKQENMSKLFQPFSQLGDKKARKTGGTGLGLAICKEIVEQSGGKIWAASESGKGSIFCFRLPIKERRSSA